MNTIWSFFIWLLLTYGSYFIMACAFVFFGAGILALLSIDFRKSLGL